MNIAGFPSNFKSWAFSIPDEVCCPASYGINLTLDSDPSIFLYSHEFRIVADNHTTTTTTTTYYSAATGI